jgi:CelD/BcsL family acetyltransferase involved in cellulose biosynthesis
MRVSIIPLPPAEPMASHVEWITALERFDAVAAQWDRLAATDPAPFASYAWLRCWWEAFGTSPRPAVCTLWRGGELVAGFPLLVSGRGLRTMANEHTPLLRPLARDPRALDDLVSAVLARSGALLHGIALPAGDPAVEAVQRLSSARRRPSLVEPQAVSPIVDTGAGLADYRARMKASFREIERRRRKTAREHRTGWRLVERPRELGAELDAGLRVEGGGWKGRAGTAILSDPATLAFYRSLAETFHRLGRLRFSSLVLDGELAAFDFALLSGNRYWLLKTGYAESVAHLGPGMSLRLAVVERCFELGLDAHEFLGVDMPWKRRFSTSERRLVTVRSYAAAPVPALAYAYRAHLRPLARRARDELRLRALRAARA